MKTITKWTIAAAVANLLLLPATLTPSTGAAEAETRAAEIDPAMTAQLFDCCSESVARAPYCCKRCCWFRTGCQHCSAGPATKLEDEIP